MDDKDFWNFCISIYDLGHNLEHRSYKSVANNISKEIQENDRILEIACGTGILTQEIVSRHDHLNYIALDYAKNMLDVCFKKRIPATFELGDATNLAYEDGSFDKIIIANALHIMSDPTSVLREVKRCLKDNGILYAPNFLTPSTIKEKLLLDIVRKFGYNVYHEFTIDSYLSFLDNNGFKVNKIELYKCLRKLLFTECTKKDEKRLLNEKR